MLSDLSITAGYGKGFFSSHSLRVGYASRIAAEGFSGNESCRAREEIYQGIELAGDTTEVDIKGEKLKATLQVFPKDLSLSNISSSHQSSVPSWLAVRESCWAWNAAKEKFSINRI